MTWGDRDTPAAAKQLLAEQGKGRATVLRLADLPVGKGFAALDKNRDGSLNALELTTWLNSSADSVLVLDLHGPPAKGTLTPPKSTVLSLPGVTFHLTSGAPLAETPAEAWRRQAGQLQQQLKGLAGTASVIPREKVAKRPDLEGLFNFADRNADSQLAGAEVTHALEMLGGVAECRITVSISDQGSGLFELLDDNSDGQLSPRELLNAPAVLKPFADPQGSVAPKNLPRRFFVQPMTASIPVVVPFSTPNTVRSVAQRVDVPAWFSHMDRNGDGEVSLREFLGPLELFAKLDHNRDGLIDPEPPHDWWTPS